MNYYNWQEIHKKYYANKAMNIPEVNYLDEVQRDAWHRLLQCCRKAELAKLVLLVQHYDKNTDTFRFKA